MKMNLLVQEKTKAHFTKEMLLTKPYDGIYEILEGLMNKGMHIAVDTNKRQDFVEELMG